MATTKALTLAKLLDTSGGSFLLDKKTTYTTTGTSSETIDTFAIADFSTVTYLIQATYDLFIHIVELTVSHNTIDAFVVRHNEMISATALIGDVTATVSGSNIVIALASVNAGTSITVIEKAVPSTIQQLPFGDMAAGIGTLDLGTDTGTEDLNI
jgi:hypothetical protein